MADENRKLEFAPLPADSNLDLYTWQHQQYLRETTFTPVPEPNAPAGALDLWRYRWLRAKLILRGDLQFK